MHNEKKYRENVLIVAPVPFFVDRGTPMRILEEALALEKRGLNIQIVTYHIGRCLREVEQESKIKVRRIVRLLFWYNKKEAGPNWQKIILDILLTVKTIRICWLEKPNIIHAHLHEGVLIGWITQKVLFWRKIKLVADFHGQLVNEMTSHGYLRDGRLKKIFLFLEKVIFSMGDWAIVSSEELKKIISKYRQDERVSVILDGVDLKKYQPFLKGDKKRTSKRLKVIYSGAFVVNKGIDILLEAILEIKKIKRDDILFILAGSPIENIDYLIKKDNLQEIVKIISPLDYKDLPRINCLADIAIDPKKSDVGQASGKILQYMAAKLPVICFDRENNRKYLGKAGFYVKDFSAKALSRAILYFAKNRDKISEMSDIAETRIKKFSWNNSGKEILEIYRRISM